MPQVTYRGPHKAGRNMGRLGVWRWGEAQTKSQEWVDANASKLAGEFAINGVMLTVAEVKLDEGNDGIPDMKWTKGDIMTWMDEKEIQYSALNTKATLLAKVQEYLNPTEDSMSEGDMDNTTGDEE